MAPKNLIFDLDGTLVDSAPVIIECLRRALEIHKIKDATLTVDMIGPPLLDIIKKSCPIISDDVIEKIILEFRKIYDSDNRVFEKLYSGIEDFFKFIKKKNKDNFGNKRTDIKLYLATNKPYKPTMNILKNIELLNYFDGIYCLNYPKKYTNKSELLADLINIEKRDLNNTIYVGDTFGDLKVAHDNKIRFAAVSWGYEKNKEVLVGESDYYLKNISELYKFIE